MIERIEKAIIASKLIIFIDESTSDGVSGCAVRRFRNSIKLFWNSLWAMSYAGPPAVFLSFSSQDLGKANRKMDFNVSSFCFGL